MKAFKAISIYSIASVLAVFSVQARAIEATCSQSSNTATATCQTAPVFVQQGQNMYFQANAWHGFNLSTLTLGPGSVTITNGAGVQQYTKSFTGELRWQVNAPYAAYYKVQVKSTSSTRTQSRVQGLISNTRL